MLLSPSPPTAAVTASQAAPSTSEAPAASRARAVATCPQRQAQYRGVRPELPPGRCSGSLFGAPPASSSATRAASPTFAAVQMSSSVSSWPISASTISTRLSSTAASEARKLPRQTSASTVPNWMKPSTKTAVYVPSRSFDRSLAAYHLESHR